ncbi:TPA: class I SAM-dependent methyltransferase [Candidatus Bathyarchaeota archaeon]|nr:class I SAM-dependent methyltransferase [Candidatus Bathyarchaeota archaeon]
MKTFRDRGLDRHLEALFRPMRETLNILMLEKLKSHIHGFTLNVGCGHHNTGEIRLDILPNPTVNVVGDARKLPFPSNVFDTVLALSFLHHVPDYWNAVREIMRVLKCGGKVVGWEPNIYHPYLITFTNFLGLSNEKPLNPRKLLNVYRRNRGRILVENYFFAARCVFNLIRKWQLLRWDRWIPSMVRGYVVYVAEKT